MFVQESGDEENRNFIWHGKHFSPGGGEKINSMKVEGVTAEFVKLGGVKMADPAATA